MKRCLPKTLSGQVSNVTMFILSVEHEGMVSLVLVTALLHFLFSQGREMWKWCMPALQWFIPLSWQLDTLGVHKQQSKKCRWLLLKILNYIIYIQINFQKLGGAHPLCNIGSNLIFLWWKQSLSLLSPALCSHLYLNAVFIGTTEMADVLVVCLKSLCGRQ